MSRSNRLLVNDEWDRLEITSISGNETASVGEKVSYTASYNRIDPEATGGENFIQWTVLTEGDFLGCRDYRISEVGETVEIEIRPEWADTEIFVTAKSFFGSAARSVNRRTQVGCGRNPQIESLSWVRARNVEISNAKYGQPLSLRLRTTDCYGLHALVVLQCEDWNQDYAELKKIEINRGRLLVRDEQETVVTFTPQVDWLCDPSINSSQVTAKVYIFSDAECRIFFPREELTTEVLLQMAKDFEDNPNGFRCFSSPHEHGFVIRAEQEAEAIPISKVVIVIDPGHGDRNATNRGALDSGANQGTHLEKDYAVLIGNALNKEFENGNYRVIMTRTGDIDVRPQQALRWRTNIANQNNADIFVSLHIDSSPRDEFYAIYQQDKRNQKQSIRLGTQIANNMRNVMNVRSPSVLTVPRAIGGNATTLFVLNNFNGAAGVLLEFGGIRNSANLNNIATNTVNIAKAVKNGIIQFINEDF